MEVSAGAEKSGSEFICTEYKISGITFPAHQEPEVTVPGAPSGFTASAGNGQVTLNWSAPSDNGHLAITGYEVTADNWATVTAKTADQTTHTFTELANGTSYTFKVRAVNAQGAGAEATRTSTPTGGL
jgi:predicted phage tail protein